MTEVERLIGGLANIVDYDIDNDFDNEDIEQLLAEGIIKPSDIGMARASDLLINGVFDYGSYPFETFSHYEQIRQLEYCAVEPGDFLNWVDLNTFESDDWLYLLEVLPRLADMAPWEKLRKEGSFKSWADFLIKRPEYAEYADWQQLSGKGKINDFFDLLGSNAAFYPYLTNKDELQKADSLLWVKLIARRPEAAEFYPLDTLDEVDEIEFLLLHQPQLVDRISWDDANPPVKLYIHNPSPELLQEINPSMAWFVSADIAEKLRPVLEKVLYYQPDDAKKQANVIGHNYETYAGIYSLQTAEHVICEFAKSMKDAGLELSIRIA